jgi:hypothetical protein
MKNLQTFLKSHSKLNLNKYLSELNLYPTIKKNLHLRTNSLLSDNRYKNISSGMDKKVYSKQNMKSQKTFEFTKDKEQKIFIEEKKCYKASFQIIRNLEKTILFLENYIYSNQIKIKETKSTESVNFDQNDFISIDGEIVEENEALNLPLFLNQYPSQELLDILITKKEELYYQKVKQAEYRKKYLSKTQEIIKEDNRDDYAYVKASMIRDVFSSFHNYGNKFLNMETYERENNELGERPNEIVTEEKELAEKQAALEGEVETIVNEMVEKDMKDFDLKTTQIPHLLPIKPILRSVVVNQNQPDILLLEADMNCDYGLDLEWERLVRLNLNDDFGKNIADDKKEDKDDDDEEDVTKEISQEEVHFSDLMGRGANKIKILTDYSISAVSNR